MNSLLSSFVSSKPFVDHPYFTQKNKYKFRKMNKPFTRFSSSVIGDDRETTGRRPINGEKYRKFSADTRAFVSSHAIYLPVYQRDKSYNKGWITIGSFFSGLRQWWIETSRWGRGVGRRGNRGGRGRPENYLGSCFLFA